VSLPSERGAKPLKNATPQRPQSYSRLFSCYFRAMKPFPFVKYSANGNDFIIMDEATPLSREAIQRLCDRHFGVGADGLLVMGASARADARMRIFNADGGEAEMCGNGLRCLATHLDSLRIDKKDRYTIETMNAIYPVIKKDHSMAIEMSEQRDHDKFDLSDMTEYPSKVFINTGVPHLVFLADDAKKINIQEVAPRYRFDKRFPEGTNVNFVEVTDDKTQTAYVRTYERGVEAETFSCGTGLTASALALAAWFGWQGEVNLINKGGKQLVELGDKIYYSGEVTFCFQGEVII
jgi:diaminopimelate epimerase